MRLNEEEKKAVVNLRLQKAKDTLREAKGTIELSYWHTAANRLYYACYYAASALLIQYEHPAQTHSGIINLLGMHFISKNIISKELGKFYANLFELRQTSDYSDWKDIEEDNVRKLIQPAEEFICTLEKLIINH
ncbi:MAG: HEPN domain-containing protein [Prevotellaceae bacterium]|jgi:uncharacterized protein (UPF0332 family)|nr:HEPN domain-containing protein [Prevotellaceae bacterium]